MNAFEQLDHHQPLFAEARGDVQVSFEFFPPKSEKMAETLWDSIQTLAPLHPRFVSVTYGAGGSTRERTHATVLRILKETPLTPAAHLTCVGATREELTSAIESIVDAGIDNVLALRGDPPKGQPSFVATEGGLRYSSELVQLVREVSEKKNCVIARSAPASTLRFRFSMSNVRDDESG